MLPLIVSFMLLAVTALFIVGASLFLPKIKSDAHREGTPKRGVRSAPGHSTPLRFPARFVLFVTYFGFGIMANVLPLNLRDHMGASKGVAGIVLLVRTATTTVAFLLLARSTFWQFRRTWVLIGQAVVLFVLAVFSFASSIAIYAVGIALFGAAMALVYNSSVFHGISGSSSRAGRMAIHESTLNGGSVTGSIVGGAIYQAASINVAFLGSMILAACSLVIVVVLMLRIGNPSPRIVRAA